MSDIKKYLGENSLSHLIEKILEKLSSKSDTTHNHDSSYDAKGAAATVQSNLDTLDDELDAHTGNSTIHVTSSNKTNWNTAYTHSQSTHARTDATKVAKSTINGNILIDGTETTVYTHPSGTNPHGTTKSDVGLGNVDNTSDANKPVSTAQKAAIDAVQDNVDTVQDELTEHIDNDDIHFTADERTKLSGIATGANKYTHPSSGVTAGTYKSVTVDAQGHVTAGTNPTTLAGYGITDADSKGAADTALTTAKSYTDTKISNLINGAPTTLDTLGEIASAMEENADVVEALEEAIGTKANASDLTAHTGNTSNPHSVTKSQVGLGNVENKSSATIRGELTKTNVTTALGYTPYTQTEIDDLLAKKVDAVSGKGLSTNDYTTTEKTKLSGIATGAEVNQNAFSNIKVGNTTVAADAKTDTLTLAGSNVTITPDATNDKITFAVADGSTSAKGLVQLTNSTSSTSTTTAATPSSVKSAYDLANTAKTNAATAQTKADSAYTLAESKVDSLSDLGITATATELNYMDGVTSNVQTQLDGKAPSSHTSNKSNPHGVTLSQLGVNASSTELNRVKGVTSDVQTQLNAKAIIKTLTSEDLNSVIKEGFYNAGGGNTITNKPSGVDHFGMIVTHNAGGTYHTQILMGSDGKQWRRTCTNGTWGNWSVDKLTDTTYSAAGSSLGLVKSGGDVTISSGVITVNDDSHNHTIANVDNLQSSLDSKQATITGGASTITGSNLTANRALISNDSGKVAVSAVTSTELGYLDGVTSNIQSQLDGKAATSHGNHVPTTETANNAKFLRNDNTWQTVTPANIGAATTSHGTHVSYSTTAPVMDGTASAGSASTVARSDHKHPTDTSRASASDLTSEISRAKAAEEELDENKASQTDLDTEITRAKAAESTLQTNIDNKSDLDHTHLYAGSSSNGGAANSANILNSNTKMDYGWNGINYFNISGTAGKAAKVNDTPTTAWWHIMRFNHANSSGYYTDLAIPFNDTSLYYKRITSGAVQNGGWVKVLDSLNYTSYCAAASHTHSYLPLSGGTISGDLALSGCIMNPTICIGIGKGTASAYPYVQFRGSGSIGSNRELSLVYYDSSGAGHFNKLMDSSGNLCLQSASASIKIHATNHVILSADGYALYFGVGITSGTKSLTPRTTSGGAADNKIVLGSSSSRWTTCFAKNGTSTSSDERDKDIFELDGRYKNLFMNTKPIIYRWNDDDSNIFHVGVGAQSYEASAHECGLTTEEVGAIRHDYWDKPNENGRTDRYSINYDEVVMLAVPFVQEHEKKIQALEEENSTLKIELAELKELVQQLIA